MYIVITLFHHAMQAGFFFQISIMFRLGPLVFRLFFARCFFDSKLFKNWVAMECRLKHTVNYINLTK